MRLNKYLAAAGVASRRKSDELIALGKVSLNGQLVREMGIEVSDDDEVRVNGKVVKPTQECVYIVFYKPPHVISTVEDTHDRPTVVEGFSQYGRLYPVGRLDKDSSGLMLLTNDGDVAYRLTHPRYEVEKRYVVRVRGDVTDEKLHKMIHGIELEDGIAKADVAKQVGYENGESILEIVLHEGKKREIRRMLATLRLFVISLVRVQIGMLELGTLKAGQHKVLKNGEIVALKRSLGFRV